MIFGRGGEEFENRQFRRFDELVVVMHSKPLTGQWIG